MQTWLRAEQVQHPARGWSCSTACCDSSTASTCCGRRPLQDWWRGRSWRRCCQSRGRWCSSTTCWAGSRLKQCVSNGSLWLYELTSELHDLLRAVLLRRALALLVVAVLPFLSGTFIAVEHFVVDHWACLAWGRLDRSSMSKERTYGCRSSGRCSRWTRSERSTVGCCSWPCWNRCAVSWSGATSMKSEIAGLPNRDECIENALNYCTTIA